MAENPRAIGAPDDHMTGVATAGCGSLFFSLSSKSIDDRMTEILLFQNLFRTEGAK
jgi:hypothetical protein